MDLIVIYDKPKDHPDEVVARLWHLDKPLHLVANGKTIGEVRSKIEDLYPDKVFLLREDRDDPCVVGVYI